jgi:2-polyprenyl-3-methyl-5-hydroxy-6-metoxy-1,4-benzoquinol methylase
VSAEATLRADVAWGDSSVGCVACGGTLTAPEQLGAVALAACARCGSRTAIPRLSASESNALHDSADYFTKEYFSARRDREELTRRRFQRLLDLLAHEKPDLHLRGRRMLDVGCDTGEFLLTARDVAGIDPYGVDVAQRPIEIARSRGVEAAATDLGQAPPGYLDFALVSAIDVVEHVPNPVALLSEIRRRLAPDGVVYLETPNWDSSVYAVGRRVARISADRPSAALGRLFPPEHTQYFTADGLRALADQAGLRPVSIFTQRLRTEALAAGVALKTAMWLLQVPDRALHREILLSSLLVPVGAQ